jgi:hypothetical protein
MRVRVPKPEERFLVFAHQRNLESISDTEARIKLVSFGCNGREHHKEVLFEIYEAQGEGGIVDVESTPTERVGPCDGSCAGNIDPGSKGWFIPHE